MPKKKEPVQDYLDHTTKEAARRADQDLKMWEEWNSHGRDPRLLQPLMQTYEPLLARSARAWKAPAVAPAAFKAELKRHFIHAAESFDPSRGVAFNTHVQARLRKAQRFNTKHQNIGYIPEGQARHIGPIQVAQNELTEELGRAPKPAEIAGRVGLPTRQVSSIMQSMRRDIASSAFESDPASFATAREADVLRLIQRRPADYLDPDEAKVFSHIYGVGGARKIQSTSELATALGLSQPKISRLKTSIAQKIKKQL